jgi:outer membrane protein TolC
MRYVILSFCFVSAIFAAELPTDYTINLETVLRLGGANNLDLQSAQAALTTAKAAHRETRMKFFPWITIGTAYRRQDGNTQDIQGHVNSESKQFYQGGVGVVAELRIGETIYRSLAAQQRALAAEHDLAAVRNHLSAIVSNAYFDLLRAQASLQVSEQSKLLAADYEKQLTAAVKAGVAFEGDQYRAQVQALRHDLTIRRAKEDIELASARLCELLRLPNGFNLSGDDGELVPLAFSVGSENLSSYVTLALNNRPELRSREAMLAAAKTDTEATIKAPFYPDLSVRTNVGGLGGGKNSHTESVGGNSDFNFAIGWRIGPGGLLDTSRTATAKSMETQESILAEKTRQRITREVLEAVAKMRSAKDRLDISIKLLKATEKAYKLTLNRGAQGIGSVLETLRSEEDLSFARLAYFDLIADFNKAQSDLRRATAAK